MSFKITVTALPLTAEFEVGSIAEALGILQEQDTALRQMLGLSVDLQAIAAAAGDTTAISSGAGGTNKEGTAETAETTARRGRRSNAQKAADEAAAAAKAADEAAAKAAAATAPPPVAVDLTPNANGVPAAFDRTTPPAPAAATPPPPAPPAIAPPPPPAPPVVAVEPPKPPSGILAGKVIENLNTRQKASGETPEALASGGKMLADWLASPAVALVAAGSSYDDAIDAIRLMSDERLSAIAQALEVK